MNSAFLPAAWATSSEPVSVEAAAPATSWAIVKSWLVPEVSTAARYLSSSGTSSNRQILGTI